MVLVEIDTENLLEGASFALGLIATIWSYFQAYQHKKTEAQLSKLMGK